jgi:exosortase
LCAFLIWFERKKIPREGVTSSPRLLAGTVLAFALSIAANGAGTDIRLGTTMLLVFWISAFTLCYGLQAAYAARFSLLLLFLTVPPPQWLMDRLMIWFQHTSVWLVDVIFRLLHVPAVRHGAFFFLPAGYFHIGPGCSGTRSMIAFLIISLILGHLLFRSIKSKVLLIASIVPILIFKNGVRIVILSLLAFYVDKGFLTGRLHSDGGILFFLLGILLWIPLVRLVQRLDYK